MRRLVSSTAASQSSSSAPRLCNEQTEALQRAHSLGKEGSLFPLLAHKILNQPLEHKALWIMLLLTVCCSAEGPWLWVTARTYSKHLCSIPSSHPSFPPLHWNHRLILENTKARDECSWANILFFVLMF